MSPRPTVDAADRAGALALFALLLALYTLTFSGLPDNPDAEVEFQSVHSLAVHHSLMLGGTPEAEAILAANFNVAPGGPGGEDRWYAWFGVGQAFVALPFYALGALGERLFPEVEARHRETLAYGAGRSEYWRHLAVGWRNPLLGAATAAILLLAARRLGASRSSALLAALLYGTATFAWPQARSTLSDVQGTFFLCLAFERWLALQREDARHFWAILWGSGAIAMAVLTRVALVPAALVIALAFVAVLFARRASWGQWFAFFVPAGVGAAVFALANFFRFGSVFETGYGTALASGTFFSYPPHFGLAGILIAPGKGLLWMAPLLLLAGIGLSVARKRGERLWPWLAAAMTVAIVAPVACSQTWHGAWTYGPRYVLPLVPFLWPAVALAFDVAREHRGVFAATIVLSGLGLATTLPGVLVDHMTHQDLALQAARAQWPEPGGADERERDAARFLAIQYDWRFAAPWAHWRIAAHRLGDSGEEYSARELFGVASDAPLRPEHDRERGWNHLAWVDLRQRLGGPAWLGPLAALLWLCLAALAWCWRAAVLGRPEAGPGGPRPPGQGAASR